MPTGALRLLALDGGGVRGLSSLMILRRLMATVDPDAPPKPCDYFDMIGGTSTGGLNAIMLGRLRMTVDECIGAYTTLSDRVFEKKSHRVTMKGKLQGRFDGAELERAVKTIESIAASTRMHCSRTLILLANFVCATSKETGDNACRATSAATAFFDPIAIGPFNEQFVDGALGANNPIYVLWNQAQDVWGDQLRGSLKCLVSIGTGLPALQPVHDDVLGIWATLKDLATETEKTAQQFHLDKSHLDDEGRHYRFNVDRGLEEIGPEESKKKTEIAAATRRYVESQAVFNQMEACANNIAGREYYSPYRTSFSLQGVPVSNHFIPEGQVFERSRNAVLHSEEDLKTVVADVLDWLARPDNSNWLLIFDNVDQGSETGAYDVRRYLPGDHGSCCLRHDCRGWRTMDEAGRELLGLLDGLPLALAQAASYIRETRLDTASYARLYKQQWDDLMGSDGESGSPLVDYEQGSVATTWTVSFKAAEVQNKNAANQLRLWAFVDGRDLWHGLLQAAVEGGEQWPGWLCDVAGNEVQYLDAVRLLLRYSMIEYQEAVDAMHMLGNLYADQGRLREAESMFQRALEGKEKALGRDHTSTLDTINNLGNLYRNQDRLTEAESMYQRTLEGNKKALGRDYSSTLGTVNNLGILYKAQGRLTEAESMFQRVLEGRDKALERDHTSTLDTANKLGQPLRGSRPADGGRVDITRVETAAVRGSTRDTILAMQQVAILTLCLGAKWGLGSTGGQPSDREDTRTEVEHEHKQILPPSQPS
ncbi:FabD/lysophospholipase-like protein [Parathielavia appendiculata]|uniref:FabD/lysophospholipase-like protein n=1 Tax=Parathielavia appendiculata TaxID=2587402 RepID=A0AAN6TTJ0_9PEZI|nr:FabD/lysophospholipase-like protein [Parathielavia appendiculata]